MPLKSVNITRWLDDDKKKLYKIDIYEDDNIEDAILKIVYHIEKDERKPDLGRFYVWSHVSPFNVLFTIDDIKWKGYNPNPLKSTDRTSQVIKQPVIYSFKNGLFHLNKIHIIFENDFPSLKDNSYYFIDKKFKTNDKLNQEIIKLDNLEKIDTSVIIDSRINVHRFQLTSILSSNPILSLAEIYSKLNTNINIQYIQWINDIYTYIHKLYIYHRIPKSLLKTWMSSDDKKTEVKSINCYMLVSDSSNSYVKININEELQINLQFILDLRKNITMEMIDGYLKKIRKYLETTLIRKIVFKPVSIKVLSLWINLQKIFQVFKKYLN